MNNTMIWDALGKTDPAHTKQFKRSGGFSGTALKPQWVLKKLTEQFGPCGEGWGVNKPDFQVVPVGDEVMVYCTVSAWHSRKDNVIHGVGGDKVVTKLNSGKIVSDDEAFKKAFTDAVMNAFKFVGVGADIHMGQFDDSKYVEAVGAEYQQEARRAKAINHEQASEVIDLLTTTGSDEARFLKYMGVSAVGDITTDELPRALKALNSKKKEEANV